MSCSYSFFFILTEDREEIELKEEHKRDLEDPNQSEDSVLLLQRQRAKITMEEREGDSN